MSQLALATPARLSVRGSSVAARSAAPSGVRLTRRGRLVLVAAPLLLLAVAVALLAATLVPTAKASTASGVVDNGLTQITVVEGDSLWSIAQEVAPQRDPRDVVSEIVELNHLRGTLTVGTELLVPNAQR